jgi:Icc protein
MTTKDKSLVVAQFSDCHLFSEKNGLHHEVNVLENFKSVLASISSNPTIDYVVFTGDLTQDHSERSYQQFVEAVTAANIDVPLLYLAGNHDEHDLLAHYLVGNPFKGTKRIDSDFWQLQLINSKSSTPSGFVSEQAFTVLNESVDLNKHQLLMMHHHPIDVGYFIDKHGLINKKEFWHNIEQHNRQSDSVIAIACGHVHRANVINTKEHFSIKNPNRLQRGIDVYTCPATSIQFDPDADNVSALALGPAYRLFYLYPDGTVNSDIVQL